MHHVAPFGRSPFIPGPAALTTVVFVTDWIEVESPTALVEIRARTRAVLASHPRRRALFDDRLDLLFPEIFRAAHVLFGWRYDFAWILEQFISDAARASAARPGSLRRRTARPVTVQLSVPASAVADLGALADALAGEPVSHVHLRGDMPRSPFPESGGPLGVVVDIALPPYPSRFEEMRFLWEDILAAVARGVSGIVLDPSATADPESLARPLSILSLLVGLVDPGVRLTIDDPGYLGVIPRLCAVDPRPGGALALALETGSAEVLTAALIESGRVPEGTPVVHPAPLSPSGIEVGLAVVLPGIPEIVLDSLEDLGLLIAARPLLAARTSEWPTGSPEIVTGAHPALLGILATGNGLDVAGVFNVGSSPEPPVVPFDPEPGAPGSDETGAGASPWVVAGSGRAGEDVNPGRCRLLTRRHESPRASGNPD